MSGDEEEYKKSRMRTASDVVSRLLWDESLPKSEFVVGYLDRFLGIVEKPFTTLDWSDPSTVDQYTLALPKHRIQYFKYKFQKVWDKQSRLDLIFGSTGGIQSIHDYMEEIDQLEERAFHENEENSTSNIIQRNSKEDTTDRPNFFVSIRITDKATLKQLETVAKEIKEKDSTLCDCCMKTSEYHLTLTTMKLDSPEEILDASVALNDLKMRPISLPIIELEGLDLFRQRVLYARVSMNEKLIKLRDNVIDSLNEWKVKILDHEIFVPHVTIAKTSRPAARARGSNIIDPSTFSDYINMEFGTQAVNTLYLCQMGEARSEDGFYMTVAEVDLS